MGLSSLTAKAGAHFRAFLLGLQPADLVRSANDAKMGKDDSSAFALAVLLGGSPDFGAGDCRQWAGRHGLGSVAGRSRLLVGDLSDFAQTDVDLRLRP